MLKFKRIGLEDIPLVREYFLNAPDRICDETVGGLFMWRDYFATACATAENQLFLKYEVTEGERVPVFAMPSGSDVTEGVNILRAHCRECGLPLILSTVTESMIAMLRSRFPLVREREESDWADYLYSAEAMVNLPGSHFGGQRNHIHQFENRYPDFYAEEITPENLARVRAFLELYTRNYPEETDIGREEIRMTFELLDHYAQYGMNGLLLYASPGVPAGFSIGEVTGDTLFVHIEKADRNFTGVYPKLTNLFAKRFVSPDVRYVNREEDVGDPGLRRSKQSYRPIRLLRKYTVEVAL